MLKRALRRQVRRPADPADRELPGDGNAIRRRPHSRSCLSELTALEFRGQRLPTRRAAKWRSNPPRSITLRRWWRSWYPREASLADLPDHLRPSLIQTPVNAVLVAEFANPILAAQPAQHDPDPVSCRNMPPCCPADISACSAGLPVFTDTGLSLIPSSMRRDQNTPQWTISNPGEGPDKRHPNFHTAGPKGAFLLIKCSRNDNER